MTPDRASLANGPDGRTARPADAPPAPRSADPPAAKRPRSGAQRPAAAPPAPPPSTAVPGGGSGTAEDARLEEQAAGKGEWQRWGPYVSDRAWGTVREDYSAGGDAWNYFPHDHARSRAYRWSEDGIAGFCDDRQTICLAVALWNEKDPFLKERMFGLSNQQGNHGEDVKEYYFFLDGTPTHSYMKMVYKYPQVAFPYDDARRDQPSARPGGAGVRAVRRLARRLHRQSLLRRVRRVRQGEPRGRPLPHHGGQSRSRARADPRPAPSLVPQHLVVAAGRRAAGDPARRARRGPHVARPDRRALVVRRAPAATPSSSSSPRTRPTASGSSARPIRRPT